VQRSGGGGGVGLVICDGGSSGALLEETPTKEQVVGSAGLVLFVAPHMQP
jgi:hypothetical protein